MVLALWALQPYSYCYNMLEGDKGQEKGKLLECRVWWQGCLNYPMLRPTPSLAFVENTFF